MANELFDAVSNERAEAAVDGTIRLYAQGNGALLRSLAWVAVEETFCTCVTGVEDSIEHHLSAIHAALVAEVLHWAEKRLDKPSQTGSANRISPRLSRPRHG